MNTLITDILQAIIAAAVPIVTGFAVSFLNAKAKHAKESAKSETARRYIDEADDAVTKAVLHTSQTYVDALKESGTFNPENQVTALRKAVARAGALLTADAKQFLREGYGDLSEYLEAQIEAQVKLQKDGVVELAGGTQLVGVTSA